MKTAEITSKKAIVWMSGMGFIFGASSLLVLIIAILNGLINDIGISSLSLPVFCSILLAFLPKLAKNKIRSSYFGLTGAIRWFVFGSLVGVLYIFKEVFSKNELLPSSITGILFLLTSFILYWLFFEQGIKTNKIK